MAFRLIGQDCAVQITLGGVADGVPNFGTTPTDIKALARRISIDEGTERTDVSALGDGLVLTRPRRSSARLEVELLVPNTGPLFYALVGYYARLEFKALSSLAAFERYTGWISDRRLEAPDGEQVERLTIEVGADGVTYVTTYGD